MVLMSKRAALFALLCAVVGLGASAAAAYTHYHLLYDPAYRSWVIFRFPENLEPWTLVNVQRPVAQLPEAMYGLVVAARRNDALPPANVALSLFSDASESELFRMDAAAAQALHLDGLLAQRDTELGDLTRRFQAAERHVVELEAAIAGRDARVAEATAEAQAARDAANEAEVKAVLIDRERTEAAEQRDAAREEVVRTATARDDANTALASARQALDALGDENGRLEFGFGARLSSQGARGGNFRGRINIRVDYF